MKNKTLLTLTLMSISGALFATDFVVSKQETLVGFPNTTEDVNVYYTDTDKTKARLGSSDLNIQYAGKSMILKSAGLTVPGTETISTTPSVWNILGNYTFDIATTDSTYNAIKNESTSYISYQLGEMTIKNSLGSATTAIIDAGSAKFWLTGGANDRQTPTLNIQTNTKFTTKSEAEDAFKLGDASRLNVTNNSTFTIASKITTAGTLDLGNNKDYLVPQIYVEAGSTLITNAPGGKSVYFKGQTNINIQGTWKINAGSVYLNDTSTAYVKTLVHGTGHTLNISSSMEVGSSTTFAQLIVYNGGTLKQSAGDMTTFIREVKINEGATFSTSGYLEISGGKTTDPSARWAKITIEKGAEFYVDGTTQWGTSIVLRDGELVLKQENAITSSTGELLTLVNATSSTGAIIRVEANQAFKSITANTKNIDIYLSTTAEAILTSDFSAKDGARIVIHDFAEDRICVGNVIKNPNNVFEAYQTINGEEVKIQNLYINNGWLSAVAVPEPAEWAMILGALALGFAIYRKRK